MESSLYWEQLRSGTIATAQPNCNGKTLGRMLLPIPPKNEQNRIISKLQTIESSLDKYTLAQEALDKLNSEIFNNLIIGIPPYDEQVRIVNLLNSITSSLN